MAAGVGLMGFTPAALLCFTFSEFMQAYSAYVKNEHEKEQHQWERTRWQTAALLGPHMKKGKALKPTDLVTFPWERVDNKAGQKAAIEMLKAGAQNIDYGKG